MPRSGKKLVGSKPNMNDCRTESVLDHLSRCVHNKSTCRYALPASPTKTYCMHKDHRYFQDVAVTEGKHGQA